MARSSGGRTVDAKGIIGADFVRGAGAGPAWRQAGTAPCGLAQRRRYRAPFFAGLHGGLWGRKIQARQAPLAHGGTCVVVILRNPSGARGISSIEQQSKDWRAPTGSNRVP